MTTLLEEIGDMVFRRRDHVKLSAYARDVKTFSILGVIDGNRSVKTIAAEDHFDLEELAARVKALVDQGVIEPAENAKRSRGQAKKILDAIIQKRSRGVGAIAKTIKIKMALKGINPDRLTPDTLDDPVLLEKLIKLALTYGMQVKTKSTRSTGKTKLILDSIITQRSGGNPAVAKVIKMKFIRKGINPDAYSLETADNPGLVKKLTDLASKLGVRIPTTTEAFVADKIEQML